MKRARDIAAETILPATQTAADGTAAAGDTTTPRLEMTVVRNPVDPDLKHAIIGLSQDRLFSADEHLDGRWLQKYTRGKKNPCIVLLDVKQPVDKSVCGFVLVTSPSNTRKGTKKTSRGTLHANIDKIVVEQDCRGKGYGSLLLGRALEAIRATGTTNTIRLKTRMTDNEAAMNLYKKFGFEIVGVMKNYYRGKVDAVEMEKKLVAVD